METKEKLSPHEFDKIKKNIQDIKLALLTTQLPDGTLRSRPMLTRQLDPDGTMWFFTRENSDKVTQIRQHPAIALGFSSPEKQVTVSTSGTAEVVSDQAKVDELWDDNVQDWFPEGKDDPNIVLLKITTIAGECWSDEK
jgi:general stress protein 26